MYETVMNFLNLEWVRCIVIIFIAVLLVRVLKHMIKRGVRKSKTGRSETLVRVLGKLVAVVIYFFAILQIMEIAFHIQPASLLAATGIVSVAFGFGAQSLVKDIISGFFILFENQIAVGDLVTINDFTGTVEEMTLRTTIIKNVYGDLYTLPNGSITNVINHSRCERGVLVEMQVSYETDINTAIRVMQRTCSDAAKEMEALSGEPEILGVSALGDSAVSIKLMAHCRIGEQFAVERELLKRLKYAFDAEGIEIPYRHIVLAEEKGEEI